MRKLVSSFALLTLFLFPVWVCAQPASPPANQQQEQANTSTHKENGSCKTFWQRTVDDPIAFYTLWLAIFTLVLATVSVFQWQALRGAEKISKDTIDLARQEFISTHRPKLIVREITSPLGPAPDCLVTCFITICNIGQTEATITESNIRFEFVDGYRFIHTPRWIEKRHDLEVASPMAPGESHQFTVTSLTEGWPMDNQSIPFGDEFGFFITGHIKYIDNNNVTRQLAFWRRYDTGWNRFISVKKVGDEYEYAD